MHSKNGCIHIMRSCIPTEWGECKLVIAGIKLHISIYKLASVIDTNLGATIPTLVEHLHTWSTLTGMWHDMERMYWSWQSSCVRVDGHFSTRSCRDNYISTLCFNKELFETVPRIVASYYSLSTTHCNFFVIPTPHYLSYSCNHFIILTCQTVVAP